jgi:hypothetical protein
VRKFASALFGDETDAALTEALGRFRDYEHQSGIVQLSKLTCGWRNLVIRFGVAMLVASLSAVRMGQIGAEADIT